MYRRFIVEYSKDRDLIISSDSNRLRDLIKRHAIIETWDQSGSDILINFREVGSKKSTGILTYKNDLYKISIPISVTNNLKIL